MSIRSHLATGAAGLIIGAAGAVLVASAPVSMPADATVIGTLVVKGAPAPPAAHCGSQQYVQVTGVFGGAQHITGACVSPDVATDARTDDVANALADEN